MQVQNRRFILCRYSSPALSYKFSRRYTYDVGHVRDLQVPGARPVDLARDMSMHPAHSRMYLCSLRNSVSVGIVERTETETRTASGDSGGVWGVKYKVLGNSRHYRGTSAFARNSISRTRTVHSQSYSVLSYYRALWRELCTARHVETLYPKCSR